MNTQKITRIEVIDEEGRKFVRWDCSVVASIQDNGRTLKLFINDGIKTPQGFRKKIEEAGLVGTKFWLRFSRQIRIMVHIGKEVTNRYKKLKKSYPDFPAEGLMILAKAGYTCGVFKLNDAKRGN